MEGVEALQFDNARVITKEALIRRDAGPGDVDQRALTGSVIVDKTCMSRIGALCK